MSSGYDSDSSISSDPSRGSSVSASDADPELVILAKIFTITPDPKNLEKPIIAEWDGTDPGPTKALFVHVCIDNTTYTSYVSVGTAKKKTETREYIYGTTLRTTLR